MDFTFLGPRGQPGATMPCLVVREALTRMTMAMAAPNKTMGQHMIKRVMAFLAEVGCLNGDVIGARSQPCRRSWRRSAR